jgi:hypothetical protein
MKIYKLSQNNSTIQISIDEYVESLKERLIEISQFSEEHYQYLQQFNFDLDKSMYSLSNVGYPYVDLMRDALQFKDRDKIHDEVMKLFEWYKANRNAIKWGQISQAVRDIQNYDEQIGDYKIQYTEDKVQEQLVDLSKETYENMQEIAKLISESVKDIPNWNNSPIKIRALRLDYDNEISAEDSAIIEVLGNNGCGGDASFSFFKLDDKFEIDDVLEAGDDDFFDNPKAQSDYFNLVNALRNPNAFTKPKTLTLYTARPKKDREIYMDAKTIPSNIFLTSSLSFAKGFALEYGGDRDVWRIRIKDVYLTMTMDSPDQRQYQVTGGDFVPIESIRLLG